MYFSEAFFYTFLLFENSNTLVQKLLEILNHSLNEIIKIYF